MRKMLREALSTLDRDDLILLSYVPALQPLFPANVFLSIPVLLRTARVGKDSITPSLALVVSVIVLASIPNSISRCLSTAIAIVALLATEACVSLEEIFARLFVMILATYISISAYVFDLVAFMSSVQVWLNKGSSTILPLYLACVTTLELRDLARFSRSKLLSWASNGASAASAVFVGTLVSAAVLLGLGNEVYADRLAEISYLALVIAVICAIYSVYREGRGVER